MTDVSDADLRSLEDALRWSARLNGWRFEDTDEEGILAEVVEQDTPENRWVANLTGLPVPEDLRFIFAADLDIIGEVLVVTADDHELGQWHTDAMKELIRRYRDSGSPTT